MANINLMIALFGGKKVRNKRIYSLTYDEYREAYFNAMSKVFIFLGILIVIVTCISVFSSLPQRPEPAQTIAKPKSKMEVFKAIDARYQLVCGKNQNTAECDDLLLKRGAALKDAKIYTEKRIKQCEQVINKHQDAGYIDNTEESAANMDLMQYRDDLAYLNKEIVN